MKSKEQLYDELLILQATNGNTTSFAELIRRWAPRLYYYVKKLVIHECDVDDILQNVWICLYRTLGDIQDISRYRVFLFAIARSKAIDYLRKNNRHRFLEFPENFGQEQIVEQDAGEDWADMEKLHLALDRLDKIGRAHVLNSSHVRQSRMPSSARKKKKKRRQNTLKKPATCG